jgi:hypothetical protein
MAMLGGDFRRPPEHLGAFRYGNGMLNAAKHLYGKGSNENKTVNKVWAAVDVTP